GSVVRFGQRGEEADVYRVREDAAGGAGVGGADVSLDHRLIDLVGVDRKAPGNRGRLVQVVLLDVRQQEEMDRVPQRDGGGGERVRRVQGRELLVRAVVVMDRQAELLKVVGALHAGGGLADLLHGGEQQADENGNDGDHHQQLDQREAMAVG